MTDQQTTTPDVLASDAGATKKYKTRFGEVELREDRLIDFPNGIFGFRDCTQFGLTRLPNVDESPLLLLQCVNLPEIAFLVADPNVLGLNLKEEDRTQAITDTSMAPEDTQFLTILTMYDSGESYTITANLRAPLLVNSKTRTAMQHILPNKEYTTQHKV